MNWNNIELPDKNIYFKDDDVVLYCADCREILPLIAGISAVVTDPPYEFGFMGKKWDNQGISFQLETWRLIREACLPGAPLLSFGGTRTSHRIACAIEDAGWQIRDTIMWVYGSGFPKSLSIGKSLDKKAGLHNPELVPTKAGNTKHDRGVTYATDTHAGFRDISEPKSPEAKLWEGYGTALKPSYEPIIVAMNPIDGTFADNALKHKVAGLSIDACRIPLNGDKPRVSNTEKSQTNIYGWAKGGIQKSGEMPAKGRFPANFIHDGSQEVMELFPNNNSGCKPHIVNASAKTAEANKLKGWGSISVPKQKFAGFEDGDNKSAARFFYNTGKAETDLLFNNAKAIIEVWNIEIANTVDDNSSLSKEHAASVLNRAVIEASRGAIHLDDLMGLSMSVTPRLLRHLCESVTIAILSIEGKSLPVSYLISTVKSRNNLARFAEILERIDTTMTTANPMSSDGYAVVATFNTTQDCSVAGARDSEFSRFKYCAKASRRERDAGLEEIPLARIEGRDVGQDERNVPYKNRTTPQRNQHPTIKPLALMTYLCSLVKMPEYNLILDPFCGSGTTLLACKKLGIKAIGIDSNEEYCEIAAKRLSRAL